MEQIRGASAARVVITARYAQEVGIAVFPAVLICPFAPIGGFTLSICCRRGINVGGCIHRLERSATRRWRCGKLFAEPQTRFCGLLRHVAGAYAIHDAFALVGVANDKRAQQRQNDQQDQRNGQHRSALRAQRMESRENNVWMFHDGCPSHVPPLSMLQHHWGKPAAPCGCEASRC